MIKGFPGCPRRIAKNNVDDRARSFRRVDYPASDALLAKADFRGLTRERVGRFTESLSPTGAAA